MPKEELPWLCWAVDPGPWHMEKDMQVPGSCLPLAVRLEMRKLKSISQ